MTPDGGGAGAREGRVRSWTWVLLLPILALVLWGLRDARAVRVGGDDGHAGRGGAGGAAHAAATPPAG